MKKLKANIDWTIMDINASQHAVARTDLPTAGETSNLNTKTTQIIKPTKPNLATIASGVKCALVTSAFVTKPNSFK